ncbi:transposable element Tc1 transposase [Arctopsyche grandis]|uniref:transposable element Tc1 transposase n=1 Tax=Arctopsyche grandis TaxID=121162 RepID=UPI00406D7857
MSGVKQLTEANKAIILTVAEEKFSSRYIAQKVGCSKTSVLNCIRKYKNSASLERKKGSGKPRKTNSAEDRLLKRMCLQNRFKSAVQIRSEFIAAGGKEISIEVVRRRLKEYSLVARIPAKKPFLTKKMRMQRLNWAKKFINWTEMDWRRVIFSDESKFNLFGSDGIHYVRRRSGGRLSEECIQPTVKHRAGQMVWGCFSFHGVGPLATFDTSNRNALCVGI